MTRNQRGYRVGQDHHRAKHSDATVFRMRELNAKGWSYSDIGKEVGCSMWTVRDIVTGKTRTHHACELAAAWVGVRQEACA